MFNVWRVGRVGLLYYYRVETSDKSEASNLQPSFTVKLLSDSLEIIKANLKSGAKS